MKAWGAVFTVAICMLASATADAAITLGPGDAPRKARIAVAEDGTGHVAWTVDHNPGDDTLGYCRIKRGATACEKSVDLGAIPGTEAFEGGHVAVDGANVYVFQYRCCESATEGTWLWQSADGGNTFSAPRRIGYNNTSEIKLGPGPFLASSTNHVNTAGIFYEAMPLDGSGPATRENRARVSRDGAQDWYFGTTGFLDPTTPIVVFGNLETLAYRVFDPSKGTNYNDINNWGPPQLVGPGDDARLASGPSGTWLFHGPPGPDDRFFVRGFDRPSGTFKAPFDLSGKDTAIFGDFTQDEGGGLTAVWRNNVSTDTINFRTSANGQTWSPIASAEGSANESPFNLDVSTAPDGGGWVVYDQNGRGPIEAVPIPPRKASTGGDPNEPGPNCKVKLTVKKGIEALAQGGCFRKLPGGGNRWGTSVPVRINGLDLQPAGASAGAAAVDGAGAGLATAAAANSPPKVTVDTAKNTVETSKDVTVRAGPVVLTKSGVDWDVDKEVEFRNLDKFGVKFFGFGVVGEADAKFTDKGVEIPINVALPSFLSSFTGRIVLRANQKEGLVLSGLRISVPQAEIGALEIKDLLVLYERDSSLFAGSGALILPPKAGDSVKFHFQFSQGKFDKAGVTIGPGVPPLPLAISPAVFLNRISLDVDATKGLKIVGGVNVSAGPQVGKLRAIGLDGTLTFDFPSDKPWAFFEVRGNLSVVEIPVAEGYISYRTDGIFKFGGKIDIDLSVVGAKGGLEGIVYFDPLAFQVKAGLHVCVPSSCVVPLFNVPTPLQAGGEALFSSRGFVVCVSVSGASIGIGKLWNQGFDVYGDVGGCDTKKYELPAPPTARAAQAGGPSTVQVASGLPQVNFAVAGQDGPPAIRVTGPGGRTIASDPRSPLIPVKGAKEVLYVSEAQKTTIVALADPPAGPYVIEALPGSTPITAVRKADGLPAVNVKAAVGGKSHRRTLVYDVAKIPGQKVRFVERAGQVAEQIGVVPGTGGKGTLRFSPAYGAAGKRQIVALVEQDGLPRAEVPVASYVAPAPRRPTTPRRLTLKRLAGDRLRITWSPSLHAASYDVEIKLSDGRRELRSRKGRSLTLTGVDRDFTGSVKVRGETGDGIEGPARTKLLRRQTRRRG